MTSRLRTLLGGAAMLAAFAIGTAGVASAQSITVNGCASLTATAGSGANVIITCNQGTGGGSGPSCSSLSITPPDNSTSPNMITLTSNCTQGSKPITGYTFSPGTSGTNQLTIQAPTVTTTYYANVTDGTTTSNTVSATYTVNGGGSGGGGSGAIDFSGCTAQGLTGHQLDLAYSTSGNVRIYSTDAQPFGFRNSDAVVVRFTTSSAPADQSSIQIWPVPGLPTNPKLGTLSTSPCVIATSSRGGVGVIDVKDPQALPVFNFIVGSTLRGFTTLLPNTTYYITYVNRGDYNGTGSCSGGQSCDFVLDFNN